MLRFFSLPASRTPVSAWKHGLACLLTTLSYLCAALFEQYASYPEENRATVWWSEGWGVALVFLYGRWALPGVFLGELLTNLLLYHKQWWFGYIMGFGNMTEALLGVAILHHYGFTGRLNTVREVRVLFLSASILPLPMLVLQSLAYLFEGRATPEELPLRMIVWYTNDALAVVYVVPFACVLVRPRELLTGWQNHWWELCALIGGIAFVTTLAFGTPSGSWFACLIAFTSLFLLWSAIRFDTRTTVVLLSIHALVLEICIARRLDPFRDTDDTFPFFHLTLLSACMLAEFLAASVAERKSAERRFVQSARWEGLGAFAGGVAHEMNNQLTVILGSAQLADDMLPKNSPVRELLTSVSVSADRMAGLVGNLLAYAGRGVSLDTKPTEVVAVVREAVAEVRGSVQLDVSLAPEFTLLVDPTLLRLAIRNLIVNGLEALPVIGGRVKVVVEASELFAEDLLDAWPVEGLPGSYLIVKVSDNGCGMSPEVSRQMFDPFFSTKFTGRGLGLAVVAGVVRQMDGCVRVQTEVGVGTTIQMNLPAKLAGSQL